MFKILDIKLDQLEDYVERVGDVCVIFSLLSCPPCSVLHKAVERNGDDSPEIEFVRCILTPRQAYAAFSEQVLRSVPALALYRGGEQVDVIDGMALPTEAAAWEVVKSFVARA
jgi:hypothetical protein